MAGKRSKTRAACSRRPAACRGRNRRSTASEPAGPAQGHGGCRRASVGPLCHGPWQAPPPPTPTPGCGDSFHACAVRWRATSTSRTKIVSRPLVAVDAFDRSLLFADALPLAGSCRAGGFATFEQRRARRARALALTPLVDRLQSRDPSDIGVFRLNADPDALPSPAGVQRVLPRVRMACPNRVCGRAIRPPGVGHRRV